MISQGAEARVRSGSYLGRPAIIKERFRKRYRHPELDAKLTRQRVVAEARCLARCRRAGVDSPVVYRVDTVTSKIYMERVEGVALRAYFDDALQRGDAEAARTMAGDLGRLMAQIHDADLVHGDPTTSNFMVRAGSGTLCVIDFGLGAASENMHEEKAVDLYVLERALVSTHAGAEPLVEEVLRVYKKSCRTANKVMDRLSNVRQRGRKRECFG